MNDDLFQTIELAANELDSAQRAKSPEKRDAHLRRARELLIRSNIERIMAKSENDPTR